MLFDVMIYNEFVFINEYYYEELIKRNLKINRLSGLGWAFQTGPGFMGIEFSTKPILSLKIGSGLFYVFG